MGRGGILGCSRWGGIGKLQSLSGMGRNQENWNFFQFVVQAMKIHKPSHLLKWFTPFKCFCRLCHTQVKSKQNVHWWTRCLDFILCCVACKSCLKHGLLWKTWRSVGGSLWIWSHDPQLINGAILCLLLGSCPSLISTDGNIFHKQKLLSGQNQWQPNLKHANLKIKMHKGWSIYKMAKKTC